MAVEIGHDADLRDGAGPRGAVSLGPAPHSDGDFPRNLYCTAHLVQYEGKSPPRKSPAMRRAIGSIHRLFHSGTVSGLSEGALLDRFLTRRDQDAFEAILARHGPMVLGVCRRILRDQADVEDAFQATFLVLMRK